MKIAFGLVFHSFIGTYRRVSMANTYKTFSISLNFKNMRSIKKVHKAEEIKQAYQDYRMDKFGNWG